MRSLAVAAIVIAVLLALRLAFPGAFIASVAPVLRAGTALSSGTADVFAVFSDAAALTRANETLTSENASLAAENRTLSQRLADLSALSGGTLAPQGRSIYAGVLLAPPVAAYDTLIVTGGSDAGITTGMEAFGDAGTPLGVVTSVTTDATRITLFSSPAMTVAGWAGDKHTALTISGTGGGTLNAVVPRAAGVAVGDVVSVPGPGALPIGTVTGLGGDPSAPNVTVRIKPAVNPFSITWVELRDTGSALRGALQCASSTLP